MINFTQEMLETEVGKPFLAIKATDPPIDQIEWKKYRIIEQGGKYHVESTTMDTYFGMPCLLGGNGILHDKLIWQEGVHSFEGKILYDIYDDALLEVETCVKWQKVCYEESLLHMSELSAERSRLLTERKIISYHP